MINYSTGAACNAEYAQEKRGLRTVVTSKILPQKTSFPVVDGMVFIEDIVKASSPADRIRTAVVSKSPVSFILLVVHAGEEEDDAVGFFTSGSEKDP